MNEHGKAEGRVDTLARPRGTTAVEPDRAEDDVEALHATAGNRAVGEVIGTEKEGGCACGSPGGGCACEPKGSGSVQRSEDPEAVEEYTIDTEGIGEGGEASAFANSMSLHGRADADYSGSSFSASGVKVKRTGGGPCTATGTMVCNFVVSTKVTLPDIPSGLTECQERNAQTFITNVLAPHEQAHVTAFQAYNGNLRRAFSVTACDADELNTALTPIFNGIEQPRQASATAASLALDPFTRTFDMDAGCTVASTQGESTTGGDTGGSDDGLDDSEV